MSEILNYDFECEIFYLSCTQEIAAIVAMLQVENVFIHANPSQAGKARSAKRKFEVKEGDLLTMLNVYRFTQKTMFAILKHILNVSCLKIV